MSRRKSFAVRKMRLATIQIGNECCFVVCALAHKHANGFNSNSAVKTQTLFPTRYTMRQTSPRYGPALSRYFVNLRKGAEIAWRSPRSRSAPHSYIILNSANLSPVVPVRDCRVHSFLMGRAWVPAPHSTHLRHVPPR